MNRVTDACDLDPGPRCDSPAGDELERLIGGIYDAAIGDRAWPDVLASLSACLGGEGAVLNHCSLLRRDGGFVTVGIDPAWLTAYDEHYRKVEPLQPLMQQLPAGDGVFIDRMLAPGDALDRTEFYADFLAPQGHHSFLGQFTADDAGHPAFVSFWRSHRRPPWGEGEMRVLRLIGPHLSRALKIDRRIAARTRSRAALAAAGVPPLSRRERECLACLAHGATSKTAAAELGLSVLTVDDYIASAMAKLGAVTRAEAVYLALNLGPLEP